MKIRLTWGLVAALATGLSACSAAEDPLPDDSTGCSETLVLPVGTHEIGPADVLTADQLFDRNNIAHNAFRYVRYSRDSTQTQFPPYAKFNDQLVSVVQYTNGLPIFTGNINFIFKNGVFSYRAGNLTAGTSLNTAPALRVGQVRGLFLATIAQFDPMKNALREQCVSATLGYYNLNASSSNSTENLVKAWKVKTKNSAYPFAYYQDNGGALIYYDNGIRTFR